MDCKHLEIIEENRHEMIDYSKKMYTYSGYLRDAAEISFDFNHFFFRHWLEMHRRDCLGEILGEDSIDAVSMSIFLKRHNERLMELSKKYN